MQSNPATLMADKKTTPPSTSADSSALPSPHSRREDLLDALLSHTTNPIHSGILRAYKDGGTVQSAEQKFGKLIQKIIDEA